MNYSRIDGLGGHHTREPSELLLEWGLSPVSRAMFLRCPRSGSCSSLIVTRDMWYEYWGVFAARVLGVGISRMGYSLDPKQRDAAVYFLATASNYGAFTTCASFAGRLRRDILNKRESAFANGSSAAESSISRCLDGRADCSPCWRGACGTQGLKVFSSFAVYTRILGTNLVVFHRS